MGIASLFLALVAAGTFALSVIGVLDPSGGFAGILFGGSLGGLLFLTGPVWLAKIFYKSLGGTNVNSEESAIEIVGLGNEKLAGLIDSTLNTAPHVANHPWLAFNWHKLNSSQKAEFIKQKRAHFDRTLNRKLYPLAVLNALQSAETIEEEHSA